MVCQGHFPGVPDDINLCDFVVGIVRVGITCPNIEIKRVWSDLLA